MEVLKENSTNACLNRNCRNFNVSAKERKSENEKHCTGCGWPFCKKKRSTDSFLCDECLDKITFEYQTAKCHSRGSKSSVEAGWQDICDAAADSGGTGDSGATRDVDMESGCSSSGHALQPKVEQLSPGWERYGVQKSDGYLHLIVDGFDILERSNAGSRSVYRWNFRHWIDLVNSINWKTDNVQEHYHKIELVTDILLDLIMKRPKVEGGSRVDGYDYKCTVFINSANMGWKGGYAAVKADKNIDRLAFDENGKLNREDRLFKKYFSMLNKRGMYTHQVNQECVLRVYPYSWIFKQVLKWALTFNFHLLHHDLFKYDDPETSQHTWFLKPVEEGVSEEQMVESALRTGVGLHGPTEDMRVEIILSGWC